MKEFLALPRQIKLGEFLRFISNIVGSSIFPFMAIYYVKHFGTFITGILTIIVSLSSFFATLYGGHLSDSIGRKKTILLGLVGVTVGWAISISANLPGPVFPWLTFVGFLVIETFSALYGPAYEAMIIDLTDESNRRYVYTISYWLINIAVMLGAGISGLFYDKYFLELMMIMCFLILVSGVIVYFNFSETKSSDMVFEHGVGILSTFKNYAEVLRDKLFIIYSISSVFITVIWLQIDTLIPVNLSLHFKTLSLFGFSVTSSKMLSIMVFINTFLIIIFMTSVNKLTKTMKLVPQIFLGFTLQSIGILLSFSLNQFYLLVFSAILYTIGEMISVPASQLLRVEMMDDNKVGSYSGFLAISQPLGTILAGFLVSLYHLVGLIGIQFAFVLNGLLGISLLVYSALIKSKKEI